MTATIRHARRNARKASASNGGNGRGHSNGHNGHNGHANGDSSRGERVLGRYRLVLRLASGGTAEIWRAVDERTGHSVAVKLLHPHLLPDPSSRARLAAEARAVSSLDHPGVVRLIAADAGERPAVVLELVKGESLPSRLSRSAMIEPHEAALIGAEIAEALYHAHTRGVIHRDVKPGNVLLGADGHARLVDFGIARLLGEALERTTQTGTVMGTLRYMAPEQLAGQEIGPRVDLYGLGAVMYEMLTGVPPFGGSSPVALLEQQAGGPPPLPGTDPALAGVVRACLQPHAEDRPRHAGLVASALRAWLADDPEPALALARAGGSARARVPFQDLETRPMAVPILAEPAPADGRQARPILRRPPRRAAVAAGLVGLLAVAALGVAILRPSPTAEAQSAPTAYPTPLPAWAAQLADRYAAACGTGPTPRELAALGREAAQAKVDAAVKTCEQSSGGGGGGKGHGHGHGGD